MENKRKALCLISYKPKDIFLDFLNTIKSYDVFVIIDDNDDNYLDYKMKYLNLNIIQINTDNCRQNGYKNSSTITLKKDVTGWDKGLYYFAHIQNVYDYEYVWFFEDDVFFYDEETLTKIDNKYKEQDILCNSSFEEAKLNEWLWHRIQINFPSPYYCGMICICRFSKKMLESIKNYVIQNNTLFFIEAFFPSIAMYNNLKYISNPDEFLTVKRDFLDINSCNKNNLYHFLKNMEEHIKARQIILDKLH